MWHPVINYLLMHSTPLYYYFLIELAVYLIAFLFIGYAFYLTGSFHIFVCTLIALRFLIKCILINITRNNLNRTSQTVPWINGFIKVKYGFVFSRLAHSVVRLINAMLELLSLLHNLVKYFFLLFFISIPIYLLCCLVTTLIDYCFQFRIFSCLNSTPHLINSL